MSIYSELADLVRNVEAANNAIVEAGGKASTTGMSGMAAAIGEISGGGGEALVDPETNYGAVFYYPNGTKTYTAKYLQNCAITNIDQAVLGAFITAHPPISEMGTERISFYYSSDRNYWSYTDASWTEVSIPEGEFATTTGISCVITGDPAMIDLDQTFTPDKSVTSLAICSDGSEFTSIGRNSSCTIGGHTFDKKQIRRIVFGSSDLNNDCYEMFCDTGAESISKFPSWAQCDSMNSHWTNCMTGLQLTVGTLDLSQFSIIDTLWGSMGLTSPRLNCDIILPDTTNVTYIDRVFTELEDMVGTVYCNYPVGANATTSGFFTVNSTTCPAYTRGITFKGPYRADIMAIIAAEASSGYLVARCIDGGA